MGQGASRWKEDTRPGTIRRCSAGYQGWQHRCPLNIWLSSFRNFNNLSVLGVSFWKSSFIICKLGEIPPKWNIEDSLLCSFLASFAIPENLKGIHDQEHNDNKDFKYGITGWQESTSTSPSSCHLGHYKSVVIQDADLLRIHQAGAAYEHCHQEQYCTWLLVQIYHC